MMNTKQKKWPCSPRWCKVCKERRHYSTSNNFPASLPPKT